MKLFISLLPEITFTTGVLIAVIAMWSLMGWQYGLFVLGAALIIASIYVNEIMNINQEDFKNDI